MMGLEFLGDKNFTGGKYSSKYYLIQQLIDGICGKSAFWLFKAN